MKTTILIASALLAVSAFAAAPRQLVKTGALLGSDSHSVVAGEAIAGQLGEQGDWHLTHGQLQGIAKMAGTGGTSVNGLASDGYAIYPNPVSDVLNIVRPEADEALMTLTDLNGAHILSFSLEDQKSAVNLSNLTQGIYLLTIQPADGSPSFSTKIIKR